MSLDLAAYLDRTGVTTVGGPDAATLRRLHRAHVMALPFENLDIALGRGISVELDDLEAKLVGRRRGGYCYENNLFFAAVLEELGFDVTRLSGRVMLGTGKVMARTHVGLRVVTSDGVFLADVGFGANGITEPLPWEDGAEADHDGWRFRMRELDDGWWSPARWHEGDWLPLYRLGPERQHHIDFVVGNHYVSTHPKSPFTGRVFVERQTPGGRWSLNAGELALIRPDTAVERTAVSGDELGDVLAGTFGLDLGADEVAALAAVWAATSRPPTPAASTA